MGRHNGHEALFYVPLADLDPSVADALLDLLAEEGIAAYVAPAMRRSSAAIVLPRVDRPLDRVYVDATGLGPARDVLVERLPALQAEQEAAAARPPQGGVLVEDEAWQSVLASYALHSETLPRVWPEREDIERTAGDDPDAPRQGRLVRRAGSPPAPGDRSALPDWAWEPAARGDFLEPAGSPAVDDDHYVPPQPPPLPTLDMPSRLGWAGLLGGPLVLLLGALLDWDLNGWLGLLGGVAFAGGFVTLVLRMRDTGPDEFDPDDGAVV